MKITTDKKCTINISDTLEYPIKGILFDDSVSFYIESKDNSSGSSIL